jgi:hypothetical protein
LHDRTAFPETRVSTLQLLSPHLWNISCRRLTAQTVNTSWVTLTATSRFCHVLLMTLQKFVDENGALVSSSVCHFPLAHHNVQRQPRTVGRLNGPLRAPTFITAPATTTHALSQKTGSTWANLTFQRQLFLAHFPNLRWVRILQIAAVVLVREMPGSKLSRSITAGRRDAPLCSLKRRLYSSLLYTSRADIFLPMSSSRLIRRSKTARSFITLSMFGYMAHPSYLSSRITIAKARSTDCKGRKTICCLLQSEVKNTYKHCHSSPNTTSNAYSPSLHDVRHSPRNTTTIYLNVHCVKCFLGNTCTLYNALFSPSKKLNQSLQLQVDSIRVKVHCNDNSCYARSSSNPYCYPTRTRLLQHPTRCTTIARYSRFNT